MQVPAGTGQTYVDALKDDLTSEIQMQSSNVLSA